MPNLKIPIPLRSYTLGQSEIRVDGQNIAEAMQSLVDQYPDLHPHLYNSEGELRPFINLFLNGNNLYWQSPRQKIQLNHTQGLETSLEENDQLMLVLSIAGG